MKCEGDVITARKQSLGQGNVFTPIRQSFCSQGGVYLCMLGYTPPSQPDTPLGRPPLGRQPPGRHPPSDTTGYYQQAGGVHPTGMHTCFEIAEATLILRLTIKIHRNIKSFHWSKRKHYECQPSWLSSSYKDNSVTETEFQYNSWVAAQQLQETFALASTNVS